MGAVEFGLAELDAPTLAGLVEAGKAVVVDVREEPEWVFERIAGSLWHPMSEFAPESWPAFEDRLVVITCAGGVRSAQVGGWLMEAGHGRACHLKGGLRAWKEAGLPVED